MTYFFVATFAKSSLSNSENESNIGENYDTNFDNSPYKIFPELKTSDFYSYIKINSDGEPFFDDTIVAIIINEVIMRMQFIDGHLQWSYKKVGLRDLRILFELFPLSEKKQTQTYHFTLSYNN